MINFDKWASEWYEKYEKEIFPRSKKSDAIKKIRSEVLFRLNLVLKDSSDIRFAQSIIAEKLDSEEKVYESNTEYLKAQEREIKKQLENLKKVLHGLEDEKKEYDENIQIERNKKHIEKLNGTDITQYDLEREEIDIIMEIYKLENDFLICLEELHKYIEGLKKRKIDDRDIKGKEKHEKKILKLEAIEKSYIKKLKKNDSNQESSIAREFIKNIGQNESELFEILLLNIEKKGIKSLKNNKWEMLDLKVRAQIIVLLVNIDKDKNNPNNKILDKYFDLEEVQERLIFPVQYRIKQRLELIAVCLPNTKDIKDIEDNDYLLKTEKYLIKTTDILLDKVSKNITWIGEAIDRLLYIMSQL